MLVDEGQSVSKNQVIAILDDRQLQARLRQAQAELAVAQAVLEELQAGPRAQTIAAAKAQVLALDAQVERGSRDLSRSKDLIRQNATSREIYDSHLLGLESAKAERDAAVSRLEELEAGTRVEQKAAQAARVEQLQAVVDSIEIDINESTLRAPYAGMISARYVDEGTVVSNSQPVFELVESRQLEIRIGLPASACRALENEETLRLILQDKSYEVVLDRLLPVLDQKTRTRMAIFRFVEAVGESFVPGLVCRIEVPERQSAVGIWVPTKSLVRSGRGLWALYVVETEENASSRPARLQGKVSNGRSRFCTPRVPNRLSQEPSFQVNWWLPPGRIVSCPVKS